MAHLTVPPRFLVLLPELFRLHAQGLGTKAPGFALLFFPHSEIRADPQIGSQLGIFPSDQRAEGEPFGDGSGVDRPAVAASGEEWAGPIDLPDAGFNRPSLVLGLRPSSTSGSSDSREGLPATTRRWGKAQAEGSAHR